MHCLYELSKNFGRRYQSKCLHSCESIFCLKPDFVVSSVTGHGVDDLIEALVLKARSLLPRPGSPTLNQRQHHALAEAHSSLSDMSTLGDPLMIGEHLRMARVSLDRLLGRQSTEDMLDSLFGKFCIGK